MTSHGIAEPVTARSFRRAAPRAKDGSRAATVAAAAFMAAMHLPACSSGDGDGHPASTTRDSAGVRIVETPAGDVAYGAVAVWVTDLIPPDSALTAVPWGVAADAATGQIYVADRIGARVAVFDAGGAYLGDYGRAGDGPGEFRSATAVSLDPYGALAVWDAGRGVISRWSSEGDLLNEERAPISYWGPGFALGPRSLVAVTNTTTGLTMNLRLVERTLDGMRTLHELSSEMAMMEMPCITAPAPKALAPELVWTSAGDSVYVLRGPEYRIDVVVGGAAVASARRVVEPIEVSMEMAVRAVESGPGPYGMFLERCGVTARELVSAIGHAEFVSPVQWIAVDPYGRLWVTRSTDGVRPSLLDVLGPGGQYEGTLDFQGVPVGFLSRSRFVGLRLDGTELPIVSIYELRESGSAVSPTAVENHPLVESSTLHRQFRHCEHCPVMVELPPGRFLMGNPAGPVVTGPDQPKWTVLATRPQVDVELDYRLAIGKYEVTFAEWDRCSEDGGCTYDPDDGGFGRGNRPVIGVSRADALEYLAWLSRTTGRPYRLPSEAEWEYAARAGTTTDRYWGDAIGAGMAVCAACGSEWDNDSTAPVGSFPPNPWGLYDMLGNVDEWVGDCWTENHEGAPSDGSALVEDSPWWEGGECKRPMKRGGAWTYFTWALKASNRSYVWPGSWDWRERTYGFRVALTLEDPASSDGSDDP